MSFIKKLMTYLLAMGVIYGEGDGKEAWLEIHKQDIPRAPQPPTILKGWFKEGGYQDEKVEPAFLDEIKHQRTNLKNDEFLEDVETFTDNVHRVEMASDYMESWTRWAEGVQHKKAVQNLYSYFFELAQRLDREGDTLDLCFGHGVLSWKMDESSIHHPLFISYMELEFNAKEGVALIKPTQKGTVMETEMLSDLDLSNFHLISEMKKNVKDTELDPRKLKTVAPLYKEFVQILDPDGEFVEEFAFNHSTAKHPIMTDQAIFFLRKRSGQLIKDDLQDIINKFDGEYVPPQTIQSLVNVENNSPITSGEVSVDPAWQDVGEDLLFPLPANEDQKEIARRLAANYGITVQGPPGTGKSHTIANLISHLLAHGKRILVTSQKERALRVLSDKVPKEIRSLCVSVLGGDTKSLQDIEDSIRSISDNMASMDSENLQKKIHDREEQLTDTKKHIAEQKLLLKQLAKNQHEPFTFKNQKMSPTDFSKKLSQEREQNGWIPDSIAVDQNPPLTDQELVGFYKLLSELEASDQNLIDLTLPKNEDVLDFTDFEDFVRKGEQLKQAKQQAEERVNVFRLPKNKLDIDEMRITLDKITKEKAVFEEPYLRLILKDYLTNVQAKENWKDFVSFSTELINDLNALNRSINEYKIDVPNNVNHVDKEQLDTIKNHLSKGKHLNKMFFLTTGRKARSFYKNVKIDDRPMKTLEDVETVDQLFSINEKKSKLAHKWNNMLLSVEGPELDMNNVRYLIDCSNVLNSIAQIANIDTAINELKGRLTSNLHLPDTFNWSSLTDILALLEACELNLSIINYDEWEQDYHTGLTRLKSYLKQESCHPISHALVECYGALNTVSWKELLFELGEIRICQKKQMECEQLRNQLAIVAPIWANNLYKQMGKELEFPREWREAWEWQQLNTLLDERNELKPESIEKKIEEAYQKERTIVEELVSFRTWKRQIDRITEPQKRALYAWKQKIKKIGKGTSKYVERYRREAKAEMDECRGAIPVWIMPVDRVIENFSVNEERFDVVIVDESSQSDLYSLLILLRAEKVVIVGDDEQISPAGVGVDQSKVHNLMDYYLDGVPQANSLDIQTSLYDIATRVFPGKLMLKEHFRCVPEIIQFSNDLSYGGEIVPLRLPNENERLEPAVLPIRVPGYRLEGSKAYNEVEADKIVDDIKTMINDASYKDRTIGVISLLGEAQSQLIEHKLRNEIGEEEMVNRKILCGDAYDFQGDERDVICLSLVIANNVRFTALTRKDAQQRFNVAVSRAQNQLRLYHSVDLDDLSAKDFRFRLLEYVLNPKRISQELEDAESLCDSQFEIDVLRMLLARGYTVRPQVQAGKYRIDLVVEGMSNRLAIECDGDRWHGIDQWEEDRERQRTLERVGWIFWRIRGSEFYKDRNKALESLWSKLDDMHITPFKERETIHS